MTRKYIGKRYVPIVSGEWDILKSYESLTIVTKDNIGYISKINVPSGISINDSKYWVQIMTSLGGTEIITSNIEPIGHINGRVWINTI